MDFPSFPHKIRWIISFFFQKTQHIKQVPDLFFKLLVEQMQMISVLSRFELTPVRSDLLTSKASNETLSPKYRHPVFPLLKDHFLHYLNLMSLKRNKSEQILEQCQMALFCPNLCKPVKKPLVVN